MARLADPVVDRRMGAPLVGRRLALERLRLHHIEPLHALTHAPDAVMSWPLNGATCATAQDLADLLGRLSRLQFAVVRRDTGAVIGLIQGLGEDLRSKTIGMALVVDPVLWRAGWPFEAPFLFADYLFRARGFRKIYFNVLGSTLERFGAAMRAWLCLECTQREHVLVGERYEDLHIFAVHRRDWDPEGNVLLRRLFRPSGHDR